MRLAVLKSTLAPAVDDVAIDLWHWFWSASRGRQMGFAGPLPLSAAELLAWSTIEGQGLIAEEWRILVAMDNAFMDAARQRNAKGASAEGDKAAVKSGFVLTPALFDAVLQ